MLFNLRQLIAKYCRVFENFVTLFFFAESVGVLNNWTLNGSIIARKVKLDRASFLLERTVYRHKIKVRFFFYKYVSFAQNYFIEILSYNVYCALTFT